MRYVWQSSSLAHTSKVIWVVLRLPYLLWHFVSTLTSVTSMTIKRRVWRKIDCLWQRLHNARTERSDVGHSQRFVCTTRLANGTNVMEKSKSGCWEALRQQAQLQQQKHCTYKKKTTTTRIDLNMRLNTGCDVRVPVSHTYLLLLLLILLSGAKTSQIQGYYLKPLLHRRIAVTPHDVITRSSAINCETTCRQTSWCVSANLLPDRQTCQLLTEEVSDDDESLLHEDGWKYIREYARLFWTLKFRRWL